MDLIYADHNRLALGQLSSFDIDFDAADSKDFELTIDEAILEKGYWIFIPNTEIGGIVDSITVNTEDHTVKYHGRNFRGILNDKIITVPRGQTYVSAQGDLNEVINELLSDAGLSQFFCKTPQTIDVDSTVDYSFEPFCTLYDGIIGLANSINFKLLFAYNAETNKVEITPKLAENFSDFLTYTKNSSVNLELQDNAMAVNHFVLVGYGENNARYQIDLFVNQNAQIMDFATVLAPIKDSQYILDNRNQQFFGIDERVQAEISDSISPIENYEYLSSKPKDWNKNFASYFYQKLDNETSEGSEVSYENFAPLTKYRKLSTQPDDWAENYASYFEKNDEGEYESIDGVVTETETYKKVKKKPKGWKENYKDYYYRTTDGLTYEYTAVEGNSKDYYKKQKYRPTDWASNWKQYKQVVTLFNRITGEFDTTYEEAGSTFRPSTSNKNPWRKISSTKAPKWKKYKYFTKVTKTYAPKFSAADVYAKVVTQSAEQAPAFTANKVYQQYETAPHFSGCYRMVYDHYGGMIAKLLENLDVFPVNKQEVSLADFDADIGDVVGGYDEKTGITLTAPILNIIYRIERGIQRSIEYIFGG
jgi:hypothetical protein